MCFCLLNSVQTAVQSFASSHLQRSDADLLAAMLTDKTSHSQLFFFNSTNILFHLEIGLRHIVKVNGL